MAGNTLAVDIVAKTDGLTAGLARATGQLDAFSASVNKAADSQAAVSGEQALRTEAMTTAQVWAASRRQMIDAETRANSLLRAGRKADVTSLGDALATMEQRRDAYLAATRAYYDGLTGAQQAAFAAQEAAANKEIEAEYQRLAARLDDATAVEADTEALDSNTAALTFNASAQREASYAIGELATARYGRLETTMLSLGARTGLMTKLMTPLGLAIGGTAVAAGVLTAALIEGERQSDAFERAVLSTNDAMGITQGRFESMANAIAGGDITIGTARNALLTLAQSGRFTGDTLQEAATAAVDFSDLTDSSMKQAATAVEQLAQRPLEAVVKLNNQYHFLTAAQYQTIAAFAQEGNAAAAAKAAIDAFGSAMHARAVQSVQDEGYIVRGWEDIKQGITGAWEALESFGRTNTAQEQITSIESQLAALKARDPYDVTGAQAELEARLHALQTQERQNAAAAKAKAAQDAINAAGVRAAADIDKQIAGLKSVNIALEHERQLTAEIEALHRSDPTSKLLQGDQFNAQGHLTKGNATYDQLVANIQRKFDSHPVHIRFAGITGGRESTSGVAQMLAADRSILDAAQRSANQRERLAEQVNSIDEAAARRHSQAMLQIKIQQLRTEEAQGLISHSQELADVQALYNQEYRAQLVEYQRELALEKGKPAEIARINAEIESLQDQHAVKMAAAAEKSAQQQQAAYQKMVQPITGAFTTSINGIIQGTQTLQMATDRILSSILLKYVDVAIQRTVQWIAGEAQMTMATVTGTTTRAAVVTAAHATEKASASLLNMATIRADAAKAAAGAYSAVVGIPYVGPVLAPIAAATAFTAVGAYEALASFDVGAMSIPRDMPAMVHRNEMILPPPHADVVRNALEGRGGEPSGDVHVHLHGHSAGGLFTAHVDDLVNAIKTAHRTGAF